MLDDAALDRMDDIVPPGNDLNPADNFDSEIPAISDKRWRRRGCPCYMSPLKNRGRSPSSVSSLSLLRAVGGQGQSGQCNAAPRDG